MSVVQGIELFFLAIVALVSEIGLYLVFGVVGMGNATVFVYLMLVTALLGGSALAWSGVRLCWRAMAWLIKP